MKKSESLFGRLNNEVRRNLCQSYQLEIVNAFLVSFTRRPFLWPCGRRQSFVTKLALGAKFAKYTKLTKIPLRNLRNQRQKICVNLCEPVKSVVKNQSIKNNQLCKTNPISKRPKMNLNHYMTKDYENKSPLLTMGKQTQTKPILGGQLALCHLFCEVGDYYISPGAFNRVEHFKHCLFFI